MAKLHETVDVVFGYMVFEVFIDATGRVKAKNEDHDPVTRKRPRVTLLRKDDGTWVREVDDHPIDDIWTDKLEPAARYLLANT